MKLFARKAPVEPQIVSEQIVADGSRWNKVQTAATWHPEPGEVLICKLLGISERSGSYGTYGVVHVAADGAPMRITGAVLVNTLQFSAIAAGSLLRIVYCGQRVGRSGHNYHAYDVYVQQKD